MPFSVNQFISQSLAGGNARQSKINQLSAVLAYLQESPTATSSIIANYIKTRSPIVYLSVGDYDRGAVETPNDNQNVTGHSQTSVAVSRPIPIPTRPDAYVNPENKTYF